jgi:GNAT superfamily N-acetyltransferase
MKIIDLTDYHKKTYINCLEDWSEEMAESGSRKARWYEEYKKKGLRVKLAVKEDKAIGMIQYLPIEHSFIQGSGLYFIYCIWIHGYKQGVGNYQHKGLGKALLKAAEVDARALGSHGIAAWGITLPFWMRAGWFRKQGYKVADRQGSARLLWKSFDEKAEKPQWIQTVKRPEKENGKVIVTSFVNGWCPAQNITYERAKRASEVFKDKVIFKEVDTSVPETLREWGIVDDLYIDNKKINTGPPPSYKKIEKLIRKQVIKKKSL